MWARRHLLTCFAALFATTARPPALWAQQPNAAGPRRPSTGMGSMTLQECIESCVRSHNICIITARYCTEKGGAHVATAHLALLLDCAEVCARRRPTPFSDVRRSMPPSAALAHRSAMPAQRIARLWLKTSRCVVAPRLAAIAPRTVAT